MRSNYRNGSTGQPNLRRSDEPSSTVTTKFDRCKWIES